MAAAPCGRLFLSYICLVYIHSKQVGKSIKYYRGVIKEVGFMGLIKQEGWKVGALLFLFFFVKGMMWLIIPYLAARFLS